MSPFIEKNPTRFFAVVGAAYVPEQHLDSYYVDRPTWQQSRQLGPNDGMTEQSDAAATDTTS